LQYKGYLIDLDGTMYRGNSPIEGAKEFIQLLQQREIPHMFITNNASNTPKAAVEKLSSFGIQTTESHVLTSAIAAANHVKNEHPGANVYMIGGEGLQEAVEESGLTITSQSVDYVMVGLDRQLTYDKLAQASLLLQEGANFISTNIDAAVPTDVGFVPGNGALTKAITFSTGVEPIFIGKPKRIMLDQAMDQMELDRNDVIMVGDNYDTDIMAGMNANIDTLMVLTGVSTESDVQGRKQPTYIEDNLFTWMDRITSSNV